MAPDDPNAPISYAEERAAAVRLSIHDLANKASVVELNLVHVLESARLSKDAREALEDARRGAADLSRIVLGLEALLR